MCVYVDDVAVDGEQADIEWFRDALAERFDCKEMTWLSEDTSIDFLGMDIIMDDQRVYLSMERYIDNMLKTFDMTDCKSASTPIEKAIDPESGPLTPTEHKLLYSMNGMIGWLSNTARPDLSLAHSRVS